MKIEINEIERDCEVIIAPKGAFYIWDRDEGGVSFPQFVIIAPALTTEEKKYGTIVTCPVTSCNGGYESADISEIETEICLYPFKELVIGCYKTFLYDSIIKTAVDMYDRFLLHGTIISKELKSYMDNEEYKCDKELLEIKRE